MEGVRNIKKGPNGDFNKDGFLFKKKCRIFGTLLINSLNASFTAHLGLFFFPARCTLLTGLVVPMLKM